MIALVVVLIEGLGVSAYLVGLFVRFMVESGRVRRRVTRLANIARLERELGIVGAAPQTFEELLVESMTRPIVRETAGAIPILVRNGLIPAGIGARMIASAYDFGDAPVTDCPEPGGLPAALA